MKNEVSLDKIRVAVNAYSPKISVIAPGFKSASVLVPLYPEERGLSLVFIKRPSGQGPHGGQISFPGGGRDPEDRNDLDVALRETEEEIGIQRDAIRIFGGLDSQGTIVSRYWVRPFVGTFGYPAEFSANPREVERLMIVPLAHIMDPANQGEEEGVWNGRAYRTYTFSCQGEVIWGLTGRILRNLISILPTSS